MAIQQDNRTAVGAATRVDCDWLDRVNASQKTMDTVEQRAAPAKDVLCESSDELRVV